MGAAGLCCGAVLGAVVLALTGSLAVAVVGGVAIASVLLVLAVGSAGHNRLFHDDAARRAETAARRERVRQAMRESRNSPGGDEARR